MHHLLRDLVRTTREIDLRDPAWRSDPSTAFRVASSTLSSSRYHTWNRGPQCALDDRPCCPRLSPQQLTAAEVDAIQALATSEEYRHVPTGTLALLAQRLGKVFASPSTWYRLVRDHKWRRPRQRVHPAKPKVGIRASRSNEIWHIDTTLIRLLDGSRAYLHAVADNFSRRILAWKVAETFDPSTTAEILLTASKGVAHGKPMLLADGGVENFNGAVDELVNSGLLNRVLARTEITFSNSLIESWWRVLKHQWLYLNTLDTVGTVEKLVAFYVHEHNTRLPHSAFRGQTPDEMYFQTGTSVPQELDAARQARQARGPLITTTANEQPRIEPGPNGHVDRLARSRKSIFKAIPATRLSWRSTVTRAVVTCPSFAFVKLREHFSVSVPCDAGLRVAQLLSTMLSRLPPVPANNTVRVH